MAAELLQFLGSLAAIFALGGLAWWLKLGPEATFENPEAARDAAAEACDGFETAEIALDDHGRGALARDGAGRILLLRPHGTHFAGRILTSAATARIDGSAILIDTAEKRFGRARLCLADSQAWVRRINAIE